MTPTPLHELTTRQRAVLLWIADHVERLGYSPTYREGQAVFGFKSPNGFRGHVIALVRKGLLTSVAGLCRSLRLADGVTVDEGDIEVPGVTCDGPGLRERIAVY